ncbi:hypothetical protein ACXR2U_03250 [Jatrophihabitans sp. YIM 134969]
MTLDIARATALADSWLLMWSEAPSLAHHLVADPFALWLGVGPVADAITDAAGLQAFVERYHAATPNIFTTRVVVADPVTNRVALTWDVERSAGRGMLSGIDVLDLDDECRIRTVWSVTGARLLPSRSGSVV